MRSSYSCLVSHVAALHGFFVRLRAVAARGAVITDAGTDRRARYRREVAAVAVADLMADHAADDAAKQRLAADLDRMSGGFDIA